MPNCELCGEPMPEGEEMFKYHGYSGPCPKEPDHKSKTEVMVEYIFRDMKNGEFWIDIRMNRQPYGSLGPFDTAAERQKAHDDLLGTLRGWGAKDLPTLA